MSSRNDILQAIRDQAIPERPLPSVDIDAIIFDDPITQFQTVLESVGGQLIQVESHAEVTSHLTGFPPYRNAQQVCCAVAGLDNLPDGPNFVQLDAIDDPHDLKAIDYAILPGHFAVAENAAIWVTDEAVAHRAIYFLTQHLAIIVPAGEIVNNMHEAYRKLATKGGLDQHFGAFISGPSKTADIEQSLVIGAHGARSLSVFFVQSQAM